jgi:aspartate aminotransferase
MAPSASMVLSARARELQAKDPGTINLAGGEPDFATPGRISEAAIRSLRAGNTHYTAVPGIPALRRAIAEKLRRENGIAADESGVLVTPGGKNAIYLAAHAVLNPGDEAIILDPSWVSYGPIVQSAGALPVRVKLDAGRAYRITAEALERAVSPRTRLLIINYPNNPTGHILHEEEAQVLERFLLAHLDVYLLSDEVYEAITYGAGSLSMGARPAVARRVITVNGFSKGAAMTGWRMGYLFANEEVFSLACKLYQHSLSCMSPFLQEGAVEAFQCQAETAAMCRAYRERRDRFIGTVNQAPGVRAELPEGAFYAWVFFDGVDMTSLEMTEYLMEHARVVGMPGEAYGEEGACAMRFSFANDTETVAEAAARIRDAVTALRQRG